MNRVTKKIVLLIAVVGVFLGCVTIIFHKDLALYIDRNILQFVAEPLFSLSVSILIASAILMFTQEQVFRAWFAYARIWIPVQFILTLILSFDTSSGLAHGLTSAENIAVVLSFLFFIFSIVIIFYNSFSLRSK